MTAIVLATLAVVGAIGACLIRALMVDEVKGRIQRRIEASLEKTIAALPDELQHAWAEEWRAELTAVIGMPLSALRFVGGARRSADDLAAEWQLASEAGQDSELIALRNTLTPGRTRSRGDPSSRDMWQRCEHLLADVLAVGKRLAGGSYDDALGALRLHNTVTRCLLDAGNRPRALVVARQTLQLAEAAIERHPAALSEATPLTQAWLRARVQRAEVGQWAGDTRSPLREAEQIAAACSTLLGPDHPTTLDARAVVALWNQWRGRLTQATKLTQEVADDRAKIQGDKHPDVLFARLMHAWSLATDGQHEQARQIRESVLKDYERLLGRKHRATLFARALVALSLRDTNDPGAVRLFERVLRERADVIGDNHPDTLWTKVNLVLCYLQRGEREKAIQMLGEAIAAYSGVLGPDHPDTLLARTYLARAEQRSGRNPVAIRILESVRETRDAGMADHPDTIDARAQLAEAYHADGRVAEAIELQRRVADDSRRVRRSEHPETRRAENRLRAWRGDEDAALA